MDDPTPIQPLGYFRPSPQKLKYVEDAEARGWRYRRIGFRLGLAALFYLIAFCFGPNLINFRQLTKPTPDYFIPIVLHECVPTVRAMKEYQRDHGYLPDKPQDLVPRYLDAVPGATLIWKGDFNHYTLWNHMIEYDFTPGNEHWSVTGPFTNGRIAAAPVTVGPARTPTTGP